MICRWKYQGCEKREKPIEGRRDEEKNPLSKSCGATIIEALPIYTQKTSLKLKLVQTQN